MIKSYNLELIEQGNKETIITMDQTNKDTLG